MTLKMAIVANGPTASNKGAAIDSCDFVVRMNTFASNGPVNAGVKVNAYVNSALTNYVLPEEMQKDRKWEFWCNIAPQDVCLIPTSERPGNIFGVLNISQFRCIRFLEFESLRSTLDALKTFIDGQPMPRISAGLATISMALDYPVQFDEIHLFGYSAISPDGYIYPDGSKPSVPIPVGKHHNWLAEKRMIRYFVDHGIWANNKQEAKCFWHDEVNLDVEVAA